MTCPRSKVIRLPKIMFQNFFQVKKLGLVRIGDEPEQHFILQRGTRNNKNRTNPNTLLISIEREPNKIRIYTELFSFNRFFDRTNDKRKILSFAILRNRVENGQFRAYFDRIWIENLTFILKIRQQSTDPVPRFEKCATQLLASCLLKNHLL